MIKQHILSLLLKFIVSERLSKGLWGLDVLLFWEFLNIASILFYNFIEIIILFYNFSVISFAWFKKYIMMWGISFSKFSDVSPVFTWTTTIGSLWNICLGLNILRCEQSSRSKTLNTQFNISGRLVPSCAHWFYWKWSIFKAIKTIYLLSNMQIYF